MEQKSWVDDAGWVANFIPELKCIIAVAVRSVGQIRHLFAAHAKWSSLTEAACNGDVICSGF